MKTERLIRLLATGAGSEPRAVVARRLAPVLAAALSASALASIVALGLVPAAMWSGAAPWIKLGYTTGLGVSCAWLVARLAQPAASIGVAAYALMAVVVAMLLVGAVELALVPGAERYSYLVGQSAARCPWAILALSIPALAGVMWALRGLAPTRLRLAGLGAGLLAGTIGAAGYALSCTEDSAAFVAVWYSLGIALCGLLGAALGGRILRW
jgi:hypothetical protein